MYFLQNPMWHEARLLVELSSLHYIDLSHLVRQGGCVTHLFIKEFQLVGLRREPFLPLPPSFGTFSPPEVRWTPPSWLSGSCSWHPQAHLRVSKEQATLGLVSTLKILSPPFKLYLFYSYFNLFNLVYSYFNYLLLGYNIDMVYVLILHHPESLCE